MQITFQVAKTSKKKSFFKLFLKLSLIGFLIGTLVIAGTWLWIYPQLPDVQQLRDIQMQVPLRVLSKDGKLIAEFGEKRRIPYPIDEIPEPLKLAFIAGEDDRFYVHPGVDYEGIARAIWYIIKTGHKGPGGSTITMQVARNFFLSFEQTYKRKLFEIFLSFKIENELSKDEILELYLNKIYLGHRAYGIGAAARIYYGKNLSELSLAESAMIAALPKAPSRINPINRPERALQRRNYVLGRMRDLGHITEQQFTDASTLPDHAFLHKSRAELDAPYAAEMVRSWVLKSYGEKAYSSGLTVTTSIDSRLQRTANQAVHNGLMSYTRRHGFFGSIDHITLNGDESPDQLVAFLNDHKEVAGLVPAIVFEIEENYAMLMLADGQPISLSLKDMTWARRFIDRNHRGPRPENIQSIIKTGDIVRVELRSDGSWKLAQIPKAQGALISLDPATGQINAVTGGFSYSLSKFNRATMAPRQPGSSFKPIIYSAALEKGFTPASLINDAPIVFDDPGLERKWRPENYSKKFFGPTRLREGMVKSRNLISIRLLREIGIQYARQYAGRFGIPLEDLPSNLSLALGSLAVTPLTMSRAYSVFANGGYLVDPHIIIKISDHDGEIIYTDQSPSVMTDCDKTQQTDLVTKESQLTCDNAAPRTVEARNVYIIRDIMKDVIRRGTGKRARSLKRMNISGKTGTTNQQKDAWFNGYDSHIVTTTWVGFDDATPLGRGEVGGRAALPIWIDFMKVALEGLPDEAPLEPSGLVRVRIDKETGKIAQPGNPDTIMEVFRTENAPKEDDSSRHEDENDTDSSDIF